MLFRVYICQNASLLEITLQLIFVYLVSGLMSQLTAMVMSRLSLNLTTLISLGDLRLTVLPVLNAHTCTCN